MGGPPDQRRPEPMQSWSLSSQDSLSGKVNMESRCASSSPVASRRLSRTTLLDESMPLATLSPASKYSSREQLHAYKALRLLIFGAGKPGSNRDKLQAFEKEMGTKKQHVEFYDFWSKVDPNMQGSVGFTEFQGVLMRLESEANVHRLQAMKITCLLTDRVSGTVSIEDVMKAIWPEVSSLESAEELSRLSEARAKIWQTMREQHEDMLRRSSVVNEPPLLPMEDRTALECIFVDLDNDLDGHVSFDSLASATDALNLPIIDPDTLNHYKREWDADGSGKVTLEQFLLMMCPAGFRAFEGAEVATHENGAAIVRSISGRWHA